MLKPLLWKDLRLLTEVFLAALALILASYVFAFLLVFTNQDDTASWSKVIAGGASLTRFSSLLLSALFGAYAFAREKEDRSSTFLACLPARRSHIVISKLILSISSVAVLWLASLAAMMLSMRAMGCDDVALHRVLAAMLGYIASGILVLGTSWLLSLFLDSVVVTALTGLLLLIPVCIIQLAVNWWFDIDNPAFFHWIAVVAMAATGTTGLAIGTVRFLRGSTSTAKSAPRPKNLEPAAPATLHLRNQQRPSHITALLWKETRIMQTPLLAGFLMIALPHVTCAAAALMQAAPSSAFRTASLISIVLSGLVFPFCSGHISSTDQVSSTCLFLSSLPISHAQKVAAKLIVGLLPAFLVAAINFVLLIAFDRCVPGAVRFDDSLAWEAVSQVPFVIMGYAITNGGILGFSLAWFLSTRYAHPTVAIVMGILMTPLSIGLWAALSAYCAEIPGGPSPLYFSYAYTAAAIAGSLFLLFVSSALSTSLNKAQA